MSIEPGTHKVKITNAELTECCFAKDDPSRSDIAFELQTEDGQKDWWRGEVSNQYGKGSVSTMTQTQLTTQTLVKIGLPNGPDGNPDLSQFEKLVGTYTEATWVEQTSKEGRTFVNCRYLGPSSGGGVKVLNPAEKQRRMALMMGQAQPSQGQQQNQGAGWNQNQQQPPQNQQPENQHPPQNQGGGWNQNQHPNQQPPQNQGSGWGQPAGHAQ